ncbi:hypothetical protein RCO48_06865 [Peribacillus frigoritolerans]|nr:hypothetical protein [Peribacillus frigoritolerans]
MDFSGEVKVVKTLGGLRSARRHHCNGCFTKNARFPGEEVFTGRRCSLLFDM